MHDHAELMKKERIERDDELAQLQLENETLRNELEAGEVSFRESKSGVNVTVTGLMASQKLDKELRSEKYEIQKLKSQLNAQIKTAKEKETELRSLIYRNEDVIRKWTNRTMTTTEDIVTF